MNGRRIEKPKRIVVDRVNFLLTEDVGEDRQVELSWLFDEILTERLQRNALFRDQVQQGDSAFL